MDLDERDVPDIFDRARSIRVSSRSSLEPFEHEEANRLPIPSLYLEKSWWRLHVFLTGKAPASLAEVDEADPLSRAILGGKGIGEELQEGPARYLWAEEVREIASALSLQTRAELCRRYKDPSGHMRIAFDEAMERGFSDERLDEAFDWLTDLVALLASYYKIAASRGNAMLLGLT
jgi:hypothetical protein